MGINLNPFTWWNGATLGTTFGLRGKARVGEDALGNVYYEGGKDTAGNPRRWVIYHGVERRQPRAARMVQLAAPPDRRRARPRAAAAARWQKPAVPNLTGTALAYRPAGALEKGGQRAAATGDYEAWTPDA